MPSRASPVAAAVALLGLSHAVFVAMPVSASVAPSPSPSASYNDGLDATLRIQNPVSRLGSAFRAIGTSSCQKTYVTLEFRDYSGASAYVARQVPVVFTRSDGNYHFDYRFVIPDSVAPGDGYTMHADPYCGDPDAAPSDQQPVTVEPAILSLHVPATVVAGSQFLIRGASCYGAPDVTTVELVLSGLSRQQLRTDLRGHAFAATARAPAAAGTVRMTVDASSCRGSSTATATTRVAAEAKAPAAVATPASSARPAPAGSSKASETAAVPTRLSPSATSPTATPVSVGVRGGDTRAYVRSGAATGMLVLALTVGIGWIVRTRRRARPGPS